MTTPSAPTPCASRVRRMASAVEFEPVPATTGTRFFTTSTTSLITCVCSSCESVADSPVVPQGKIPWVPLWICHSMRSTSRFSSTLPFLKGVMSATSEPENMAASNLNENVKRNKKAELLVTGYVLDLNRSLKYLFRRTGHVDVIILRLPFNLQIPATQMDGDSPSGLVVQCRKPRFPPILVPTRACSAQWDS